MSILAAYIYGAQLNWHHSSQIVMIESFNYAYSFVVQPDSCYRIINIRIFERFLKIFFTFFFYQAHQIQKNRILFETLLKYKYIPKLALLFDQRNIQQYLFVIYSCIQNKGLYCYFKLNLVLTFIALNMFNVKLYIFWPTKVH